MYNTMKPLSYIFSVFPVIAALGLFGLVLSCSKEAFDNEFLVTDVVIDAPSNMLSVGETLQLTATVLPDIDRNLHVEWSSSDKTIATVDATGLVRGIASGTVTLTAASIDNLRISSTVVLEIVSTPIPVTAVLIEAPSDVLVIGKTLQLIAIVVPENAANPAVTWSSSNDTIATVDATGVVTGIALGEVDITATSQEHPDIAYTLPLQVFDANRIALFTIAELESVQPIINDTEIIFEVDFNIEGKGVDVAALTPVVTHTGSTLTPDSGVVQDFRSRPLNYTVRAESGEERIYTVSVKAKPGTEFITTWNETTITVPINPSPELEYYYNIDVDNDGFIDQTGITGNATVTFPNAERTLRISGQFPAIRFFLSPDDNKIETLQQWGTVAWESMDFAFAQCSNLRVPATDVPDLSAVTDMSAMFFRARNANPDVSQWDTSNITDMGGLFSEAVSARPNVRDWNTSQVTDMSNLFSLNPDIDPDVSMWETGNVANMSGMFNGATSANPNVTHWDTRNVTALSGMFNFATSAFPNVSNWETGKVVDMGSTFQGTNANPDVRNWDTRSVTRMSSMFSRTTNADPDVSQWDMRQVTNVRFMFSGATQANPDMSQWNISSMTTMQSAFENSGLSREHYEKALIRFAEHDTDPNNEGLSLPTDIDLVSVPVSFCSQEARDASVILEANGWSGITGAICASLP